MQVFFEEKNNQVWQRFPQFIAFPGFVTKCLFFGLNDPSQEWNFRNINCLYKPVYKYIIAKVKRLLKNDFFLKINNTLKLYYFLWMWNPSRA